MKTEQAHRRHAVRVAGVATLIVMAAYVVAALLLNMVVSHHFVTTTDARLGDRLADARQGNFDIARLGAAGRGQPGRVTRRRRDTPVYIWSIAPSGSITPVTPGAPASAGAPDWDTVPVSGPVSVPPRSLRRHGAATRWLVAGQSRPSASNVRTARSIAEPRRHPILAVAAFAGATGRGASGRRPRPSWCAAARPSSPPTPPTSCARPSR